MGFRKDDHGPRACRLVWEYWLAHPGTVGEIGEGFEGEVYLAPQKS